MNGSVNGFVPVIGAFYCIFHPTQGSKVMCQVPDGVVVKTATSQLDEPLISFDDVKNYLIPKPQLCNRLVSVRIGDLAVIGHPVNIVGDGYERNSFTYNFVFIFPSLRNAEAYESAIVRLAKLTKALEEQSRYLSNPDNIYEIDSVLEQTYQDLNNFSECQIPFDRSNKVNIKLFPILGAPPELQSFQVPVATARLSSLIDEGWDPTMERIIPYVNGINSVRRIADLAEANYELTRQCIQHLIHYDCVVMIGIVQFSNVYTATPEIGSIATNNDMFQELRGFVYYPSGNNHGSSFGGSYASGATSNPITTSGITEGSTPRSAASSSDMIPVGRLTRAQAFQLYTAFHTGTSVYLWYTEHKDLLQNVDIRRFLIFGVIKRLIRRVHSYPIYDSKSSNKPHRVRDAEISEALRSNGVAESVKAIRLVQRAISGSIHFDELCTELRAPRSKVSKLLKSIGEWSVVNR